LRRPITTDPLWVGANSSSLMWVPNTAQRLTALTSPCIYPHSSAARVRIPTMGFGPKPSQASTSMAPRIPTSVARLFTHLFVEFEASKTPSACAPVRVSIPPLSHFRMTTYPHTPRFSDPNTNGGASSATSDSNRLAGDR